MRKYVRFLADGKAVPFEQSQTLSSVGEDSQRAKNPRHIRRHTLHRVHQFVGSVGKPLVVAAEKRDPFPSRLLNSTVARASYTGICLSYHTNSRSVAGLDDICRSIGRT